MSDKVFGSITIQNAQIIYRNFAGEATKFTPAGIRSFAVLLDPPIAADLAAKGWNVKYRKVIDPGDTPQAFLPVAVSYRKIPPIIYLVTIKKQTRLYEPDIHILDWAEIKFVDLIINPSNWEARGDSGVKAYLKKMFVNVVEDELADKYNEVPDFADRGENN